MARGVDGNETSVRARVHSCRKGLMDWPLGPAAFACCEAMRQVEPGRWQRVRIEFEYESRNFLCASAFGGWPECPLDVVELREVVKPQ
jgi:hypothetical protein